MLLHRCKVQNHSITPPPICFLPLSLHSSLCQLIYSWELQRPPSGTQPGAHDDMEGTYILRNMDAHICNTKYENANILELKVDANTLTQKKPVQEHAKTWLSTKRLKLCFGALCAMLQLFKHPSHGETGTPWLRMIEQNRVFPTLQLVEE